MIAPAFMILLTGAGLITAGEQAVEPPPAPPSAPLPSFRLPSPPVLLRAPQFCFPHEDAAGKYDFADCFNGGDYPFAAWQAREQGVVGVRVTMGAGDRPNGCEIAVSSGSTALDRATCDLLRQRIVPDRRDGTVVAGDVRWVLPDGPPHDDRPNLLTYFSRDDYPAAALRANEQGITGVNLEVGANGRVTDCYVTVSSGSPALDQTTCRIIRSRTRYRPARDAADQPVPGRDTAAVAWRLPEE